VKLSARVLKNVDGLNAWAHTDQWTIRETDGVGESVSLYYQIVDLDREDIRHIPSALAAAQVTFPNLDDDKVITLDASFPFADDRSIMKVDLSASQVPASGAVKFSLTDGGVTRTWSLQNAMRVEKTNSEIC
jgi:hypothetical protein